MHEDVPLGDFLQLELELGLLHDELIVVLGAVVSAELLTHHLGVLVHHLTGSCEHVLMFLALLFAAVLLFLSLSIHELHTGAFTLLMPPWNFDLPLAANLLGGACKLLEKVFDI